MPVTFDMRCNRSIDGEQQVNDPAQDNKLVTVPTKELTLVSTRESGEGFEAHVQHATMSATLLFAAGMSSAEYDEIRRGKNVRVTVEVLDDAAEARPSGS